MYFQKLAQTDKPKIQEGIICQKTNMQNTCL